tara:strand:+ start:856 stop:1230 length:375 start_codon:yes stop_codon:yes gene_type:complete
MSGCLFLTEEKTGPSLNNRLNFSTSIFFILESSNSGIWAYNPTNPMRYAEMISLEVSQLSRIRKVFAILGVSLLFLAALMLISTLVGVIELEYFEFFGHSGLRTVAAIAVAGCLLAAFGYHEEK